MAEKGRVFTGARARLLINGVKVGYARGCNGGEEITFEPVKVLDDIQTKEHVPTTYDVRFSASEVRIIGETLKSRGVFPSLGSNSSDHLRNILTNGELTITIEDNQTGALFMTLEQARASRVNWTLDAVGMVASDVEFVAIRMRDESET
jgi:hypothetical protein